MRQSLNRVFSWWTGKKQAIDRWAAAMTWRWYHAVAAFVVAAAVVVVRRADLVTHAQFWAEDGRMWYQGAYQSGALASMLVPASGYFQTVSRLAAAAAQLVPLRHAPLLFNVVAVGIKCLPVVVLFAPRFRRVVPDFTARCLMAAAYLCLPDIQEIYANVTNAHAYLALLAFMTVVADKPRTWTDRLSDGATYFVSGLSGPFVVLLLPIVGLLWLKEEGWTEVRRYWPLLACGLVQGTTIILSAGKERSAMALGATPWLLLKIVAVQVFLGATSGMDATLRLARHLSSAYDAWLAVVFLAGAAVMAYAAVKARVELRLFLAFAALTFAAALLKPMASLTEPQWQVMAEAGRAERYWFFMALAFLLAALWCLARAPRPIRLLAGALLAMGLLGLRYGFFLPAWTDLGFARQAEAFSALPPGAVQVFPLAPPGWTMTLIKK